MGTNAVGDSLLVTHLSSELIDAAVSEVHVRADDPHLSSSDRGEYLVAASNLARHLDEERRAAHFGTAMRLAISPTPSDYDCLNAQYTHKLGGFRINGMPHSSRGQALALAALLASSDAHRKDVRHVVYSLLGEEADYWPTIALQQLGDTVKDDLAFLATKGWAIRSLVALLWAEHGEPDHLGKHLATDPDVRVRRALARALVQQSEGMHADVRDVLAADPAYSVRTALKASPAP